MKTVEERLEDIESKIDLILKHIVLNKPKEKKVKFINNKDKFKHFSDKFIENNYQLNINTDSKYYGVDRKTIYNWRKRIEENL